MKFSPQLFTQLDVSPSTQSTAPEGNGGVSELVLLMRQMVHAQDRQNELLEEMLSHMQSVQRQRTGELGQWKQANPQVARSCRQAAESLSRIQTEFIANLTEELNDNSENLLDGDFLLNEFIDRYGPRLAHLNGVLQMLSQLSAAPDANSTT